MAGRGKGNNSSWLTLKFGEREVLYRAPPQNKLKAGTLQPFLASNSTSQEQCFFNGIPSPDPVYKEKWGKKKKKRIQKKYKRNKKRYGMLLHFKNVTYC